MVFVPPPMWQHRIFSMSKRSNQSSGTRLQLLHNVYTGTDISILSTILLWLHPRSMGWLRNLQTRLGRRNDGQLCLPDLSKDLEIVALDPFRHTRCIHWSSLNHRGFHWQRRCGLSVVKRTVQDQTVNYIERFVELTYRMITNPLASRCRDWIQWLSCDDF